MYHCPVKNELTKSTTEAVLFINPKTKAMQLHGFIKRAGVYLCRTKKTLLMMKTVAILLFACSLHVSAKTYSQTISLSLTNAKLASVFAAIEKQTDLRFVYTREQLNGAQQVNISVKDATLEKVLGICFADQPLSYVIEDRFIIIRQKPKVAAETKSDLTLPDIRGKIINEEGEPVAGVTIAVKGTKNGTTSDANGEFLLTDVQPDAVLQISSIGYEATEVKVQGRVLLTVLLKILVSNLDETVVIAYGTTTKRLNTGSVGKVTAEEISRQPVSNPLATLQGRVPGLLVTQGNGLPGSGFSVLIRGRNSIQNGTDPLYIIDGVPFLSNSDRLTQRSQVNASSPFNTINPGDIQSIEILKDADATAIYGSRGANGVILITTKKGAAGKTELNLSLYSGWGRPTRTLDFMNTAEYVAMRKEAFSKDGVTPTVANAPDLLRWDTTRYTNWKKLLIGGTAKTSNAQLRFSGGSKNTQFSLGANYYKELTVFPGDVGNTRNSVHLSINHQTEDKKFLINISTSYGEDISNLFQQDITQYINAIPNAPSPYDSSGKLNWSENGASYNNPMSYLLRTYRTKTGRLTSNFLLLYKIGKITLKSSFGYNNVQVNEKVMSPIAAQDPTTNPRGSAGFADSEMRSWIIEPQLEYQETLFKKGKLIILGGASWQESVNDRKDIRASGYTTDLQLNSTAGASQITSTAFTNLYYRYQAIFGRLTYNYDKKYLLNVSYRRDGSSRFGSGRQYANFFSVGTGWIFKNENGSGSSNSILSFGKVRSSYGVTGNDQIGDYQYLDTWSPTSFNYQGLAGIMPTRITNPYYSWEQKRNFELALELGMFSNSVMITTNWFLSRSDNQIIRYTLPTQTGSDNILRNFPGVVENRGWEVEIKSTNIRRKKFTWETNANITIPRNKLVSFPGLENSSYATTYIIGEPLNITRGYNYLGIDPVTGAYSFEDINRDGKINSQDFLLLGTTSPVCYGGLENRFKIKNFDVSFLLQYVNQKGRDPIYSNTFRYGQQINQPRAILDHWQKAGDEPMYQRYTQTSSSPAWLPGSQIASSSAAFVDASFMRLKNVSISYHLKNQWMKRTKLKNFRVFLEGQNLFTITNFKNTDPETQSRLSLPPLRMIAAGLQLTF